MRAYTVVDVNDFVCNPFYMIGTEWMAISAGSEAHGANSMTASWGGLGIMWQKEVAIAVIRPQRFTKSFVDRLGVFSLSFFDESNKDKLRYIGGVSGKDEADKLQKVNLSHSFRNGTPFIAEARLSIFCKTLFRQQMSKDSFIDLEIPRKFYEAEDWHHIYIAEINEIIEHA